jgi:hypothetical protein
MYASTMLVPGEAELSTRSSLHHRRSPDGPLLTAGQGGGPGVYMTDEVFLYRLAGIGQYGSAEFVELEDCYRLDVVQVPISDLRARALRIVTPSTRDG